MTEPTVFLKKCPFCAEMIYKEAIKCKHCGETLDVTLRAAEETKRTQQTVVVNNGMAIVKHSFPHIAHFIGCVFTCGGWAIIWFLHYIFRDRNYYN